MNTVKERKRSALGWVLKEKGFREALYALPNNQQKQAREEISDLCYWTQASFYTRSTGKSMFRIFEVRVIEKYFAERGLDAWTGQMISNSFNN